MKLSIIILLLFLIACKGETITCYNTTTIKEVIKEVQIPCVCSECPELPKEKVCPKLDEATVSRKLNLCNIRYDELNKLMFKCLKENNTVFIDNLTVNYNDCIRERDNCEGIIHNISGWIK